MNFGEKKCLEKKYWMGMMEERIDKSSAHKKETQDSKVEGF